MSEETDMVHAAFPRKASHENDQVAGALIKIIHTFEDLHEFDEEVSPLFGEFLKIGWAEVRPLIDATFDAAKALRAAADRLDDAAITLDVALLDRLVTEKNRA